MSFFKKFMTITLLFGSLAWLSSCSDTYPNYYEGGNAQIESDIITLSANAWLPNGQFEYQWYQEFELTGPLLSTNGVIIAYTKNSYGQWESLPMTTVLWDADGTTYSEELWYSFSDNGRTIAFDYRNTHPTQAFPPASDMTMKIYFIDDYNYSIIQSKGVNFNDHQEFMNAVTEEEIPIQMINK